jgi:site-specific recombinase XerD
MARQPHQSKTRRPSKNDVEEFVGFTGLRGIAELRRITRTHVIAWSKDLEKRNLASSSIRRKLSALSALFDYLCEPNAVAGARECFNHAPLGVLNRLFLK